jgi:hypothetical protein
MKKGVAVARLMLEMAAIISMPNAGAILKPKEFDMTAPVSVRNRPIVAIVERGIKI